MEKLRNTRGITLIALVVTIVVLLILAAVSISMLGGENGIITQAQQSKDKTEQAKVEEMVSVAIGSLMAENNGDTTNITPAKIAEQVNKENNRNDVTAEGTTFPTNIVFGNEERKVGLSLNLAVTSEIKEKMYNADVAEEDIAPTEIFSYAIINDAETGATTLDSLPTKEARITGIKEKYCNSIENSDENTNYEIVLDDGSKITDTLVIPYQVEIDGEMYKITEVNIFAVGKDINDGYALPQVKTIIYPNTIKKITGKNWGGGIDNYMLTKVILPNNLNEIGEFTFYRCNNLKNIEIPSSVTSIGRSAFSGFSNLTTVNYNGTIEQWKEISIDSSNTYYFNNAQIICSDGTLNQ